MRLLATFFLVLLAPLAQAAEPELMVALSVMGYGYKVKILVNGADIGVTGGKSEGRRLFNKGHEMAAKAAPALRARNFVLVPGDNEFVIEYAKETAAVTDQLDIRVEAEGYPQPLLRFTENAKAAGSLTLKLNIAQKAPADFKPMVLDGGR